MPLPIFSQSFRICFLLAAAWAAAVVPLWLAAYAGIFELGGPYGSAGWHAHELVYGYVPLVIAGFLFTAIPNWTGRPPLGGWRLMVLTGLWVAGRVAFAAAGVIGIPAAAAIDGLFLAAVIAAAARELIASGNRRNLIVVALVGLLLAANLWFHAETWHGEVHHHHGAHAPLNAGIAIAIALIILIGGRIVPNFTRNWLARRNAAHLPAMPSRFDMAAAASGAVALASWVFSPDAVWTGVISLLASVLLLIRLYRWRGWQTFAEPLLVVLHVGYFFVPLGFLMTAARLLAPDSVPPDAALHTWTVGAVGVMTLAVMTRASLGHSGQPLTASKGTTAIYVLIVAAALLRIAAPFVPEHYLHLLQAAGTAWMLAFGVFLAAYGPLLLKPRAG
jgi:uncharacterized protein involved in response to NO